MSTKTTDGGFYTEGPEKFSGNVNSIPLNDAGSTQVGKASIGQLVSNASTQVSDLVRNEVELAKTEIMGEVKKGAIGGGLFTVAGVVALYSSFFFFFFLAELLDVWLPRWSAFLIVFALMLVIAGIAAMIGLKKFKSIKSPDATIDSVKDMKGLVPGQATKNIEGKKAGMYT